MVGVASSGGLWGLFKDRERQLLQAEFAARAKERITAIAREVRDDVGLLYATSAFFTGSQGDSREEFLAFVESLTSHVKSVLAVEWAPRVDLHDRNAFEERLLAGSDAPGGIVEYFDLHGVQSAGVRDVYFPAEYVVAPSRDPADILGFDHASVPARWNAMQRAIKTRRAVATERLPLIENSTHPSDRLGIFVFVPVFTPHASTDDSVGAEELSGFIVGVYRVSDVIRRALADFSDKGVNCLVADVTNPNKREQLHLYLAGPPEEKDADSRIAAHLPHLAYSSHIHVPGRNWIIECWPGRDFVRDHSSILPIAGLATGLVGTCMLALLIWIVDGRADEVERIVVERTAALQNANDVLEAEVSERLAAESKLAEHARNLEESNRQLEQARAALQRQATVDSLTGVMNRHCFGERLSGEWNRACRMQSHLSCILLDVDFFKKINDTYGHPVGDRVLKSLAALLQEETREYDCVARFGGEEFCILLPNTSEEAAIEWADRFCKTLAAHPMSEGDDPFFITASLGVSSRTGDVQRAEELLNQADEAMLIAKRQGRNRLVAFRDLHRLASGAHDSGCDVFRGSCASDIMTPVLVHATPGQSLQEAARLLLSLRLDSVPVIDHEDRTLGIIGEEDLTAQILSDKGWRQVVEEVMNTTPVTYDADTPAADICEFLSRVTVRRVIILQEGRPVGLISRSTLIRWLRNALLSGPDRKAATQVDPFATDVVTGRLLSTIERLTDQVAAMREGVEASPVVMTPVVVSAATRIQELVDDALMLTADQHADTATGYATMGAVLS